MPDHPVLESVQRYRQQLANNDAEAIGRLVNAYGRMFKRLQGDIDALTMEISEKGIANRKQIQQMQRYRAIMGQIGDELTRFSALTQAEAEAIAQLGIDAGSKQALELISQSIAGDMRLVGNLAKLPTEAIETLLGFLAPDSPLYERIGQMPKWTSQQVADAIVEGVGLGHNPRKIAESITTNLGMGLTQSMRTVRTVQLWSYREASRATYIANDDVVEGWVWHANLNDPRTCMSCIVQHGTVHKLTETLNDHHNGRCSSLPLIKGLPSVVEQMGTDWFEALPESEQRRYMGKARYEAWREGKFELGQISGTRTDDVYGDMRTEVSLRGLTGEQ